MQRKTGTAYGGSRGAVYTCVACGKLPCDPVAHESGVDLCRACLEDDASSLLAGQTGRADTGAYMHDPREKYPRRFVVDCWRCGYYKRDVDSVDYDVVWCQACFEDVENENLHNDTHSAVSPYSSAGSARIARIECSHAQQRLAEAPLDPLAS